MFTGIVERTVHVNGVAQGPKFRRITIAVDWPVEVGAKDDGVERHDARIAKDAQGGSRSTSDAVRVGDSVAINGVCLTVAEIPEAGLLGFDAIKETLDKTNLGLLNAGDEVHVERALRVGDRIDGHFVLGHVDGTARIVDQKADAQEWRTTLEAPDHLVPYLAPKGSAALDGISLTIARVDGPRFEVALIPTTLRLTTIGRRPIGWPCNFEADIITKSVVNWLEGHRRGVEDEV